MIDIQFILFGDPCNPTNWKDINYVLDFVGTKEKRIELSVDTLAFVSEDYDKIQTFRNTYGDYHGMPFQIVYPSGLIVDYYLDFSDSSTVFRERSCEIKLKRYKAIDNFFDNADGLSFGIINWSASDFKDIDYVVVPETSFLYFISLSIATFSLAQELAKAVQEIAEGIADLTKAAVPVGAPIPGPDWGAIIVAGIKLAARIAYAVFIIIALIQLTTEILNIIFPKIREFKGIKLKRLVEKGCQYLGYTLQSSMLDAIPEATICPVPLKAKNPTFWKELFQPLSLAYTNGYPSVRDTVRTLGQVLNFLENDLNAIVRIEANNVVRIEIEPTFEQLAVDQLNEAFNLQDQLQDETGINSEEIFKRLVINWSTDPNDLNTYDDTKKSIFESSSELQASINQNYQTIKGVRRIDLPFARGTRKGSLTFAEKSAKVFAQAIDLFCGTNLVSKVEARKNVMQISSQYFSVTKLLYMSGSKLVENQNAFLGSDVLAQNYWSHKYIENNQKVVKQNMPLELTWDEFYSISLNNYLTLSNASVAKLNRVSWNQYTSMSEIDYEVKKVAVNEQTQVINAG